MTSRAGTPHVQEETPRTADDVTAVSQHASLVGSKASSARLRRLPATYTEDLTYTDDLVDLASKVLITQTPGDDDDDGRDGVDDDDDDGSYDPIFIASDPYSDSESGYSGLSDDPVIVDIDREEDYDTDLEADQIVLARENTEFDVTGKLDYLRECERLGVTAVTYFARHISDSKFVMRHHGLGPLGARALAKPLEINMSIETLDLEGNHIEAEGGRHIANVLKDNLCVKKLVLSANLLRSRGAESICDMMADNMIIVDLDLSNNGFKDTDGEYFYNMLQKNTTLRTLSLKNNDFEEDSAKWFYEAFVNNESVKSLDLSWNHFRLKAAESIANIIRDNYGLTYLNLSMNGLADAGAKWLGLALKQNQCLTELNVSGNRISRDGAAHIARGIETNEVLATLRIGHNPIGVEGSFALLNAIEKSNESTAMCILDMIGVIVNERFEEVHVRVNGARQRPLLVIHGGVFFRGKHVLLLKHVYPELDTGLNPLAKLKKYADYAKLRLVDIFKRFDRDGNWMLSREEFQKGIEVTGIDLNKEEITMLMARLDTNRDGMVDYGELMRGDCEFRKQRRLLQEKRGEIHDPDSYRVVTLNL